MKRRLPEHHPNGYFYGRFGGKRVNLGKNLRKATERLRELEDKLNDGKLQEAKVQAKPTLVVADGGKAVHIKELAVKHLTWVKKNRAEETYIHRQRYVCQFLDYIGDRKVAEITFNDLDAYYTYVRKYHSRGANGGNHALRDVKTMFHWGEEFGVCDCPVKKFPKVSQRPPTTKKFTKEEIAKLLEVVKPDFADLIRFAIMTGLRPIEIRTLKKTDIELGDTGASIRIEHHKTSATSRVPLPRSVPLTIEALGIVQRQIGRHPKTNFVFLSGRRNPYDRNSLRIRLERACRRAKIPARPPYAWRHFFGTMQGANGTNLAIIAQLMGHSTIQMSCRYISNSDEAHLKAVSMMGKYV